MGISFNQSKRLFILDAGNCTYIMHLAECGFLEHAYYGPALAGVADADGGELLKHCFAPDSPRWKECESPASMAAEFSSNGIGDYARASGAIRTANGHIVAVPLYQSHRIYKGKAPLDGLPASYGSDSQCETLEITLFDEAARLEYILSYTVFEQLPVIARSLRVVNRADQPAVIERLYSATVDLPASPKGYDLISFPGAWARERQVERRAIAHGITAIGSTRGISSHQMNPAFVILDPETTETAGAAIGQVLLYSGSWQAEIELNPDSNLRTMIGINPTDFRWPLAAGEEFQTPEMLLIYARNGLEELTHASHDFFRRHILRGPWRDLERPVLINNWEATYFDFNEEKLLNLARTAAGLGCEMLVLDDGWFGHRDADNSSLGDWFVDLRKLPGGIDGLSRKIHDLGLKFGLWFEPEMISEDSELYRSHPDYCLHIDGRRRSIGRQQMMLDMSRPEVVDCVFGQLCKIFDNAQIDYMKWDCNRSVSEVGSAALPAERQGEVMHRYVLGFYDLLGRMRERYPNLLIEGCAGGGGRFDAGALCYTPQIWCSDNSDAVSRLAIQYGTSFFYPCSAMGAHVSDCPNHQVRRTTPFETRGLVALSGTFGYELDPSRISEEERRQIPAQIKRFHEVHHLVTNGDYYRNIAPGTSHLCAWSFVSKDKAECIAFAVTIFTVTRAPDYRLKLRGLDPAALYRTDDGQAYSGSVLMNVGLPIHADWRDANAQYWHLTMQK